MTATYLGVNITAAEVIAAAGDSAATTATATSGTLDVHAPEPGYLEQRPDDWWEACIAAIAEVNAKTSLAAITLLTIHSELRASVFLDGEREVIRPAILDGDIRGPHTLLWLRKHQAIAYKRVQHLLQPADYLRLMLTGEIATTPADAEHTGLFDAMAGAWDAEMCDELEINVELLPPVRRNTVTILSDLAATLGVPVGVDVV